MYRGANVRMTADFSSETLQARRKWGDIFKLLKEINYQSRVLYLENFFQTMK